jgi:mannose-6-phosphate isomerase class I
VKKVKKNNLATKAFDDGDGIVRLAPTWVPRVFLTPGGRLKLAPEDLYSLGVQRGGIDERWLASTVKADNPGAPDDEGLSYIVAKDGAKTEKVLLKEAVSEIGEKILGKNVMHKYGGWTVLTKFFDNAGPIPFHLHQREEHARLVGQASKPEAYFFPVQLNVIEGRFPYTFLGLNPETTKDDIKKCIQKWDRGDNGILAYSKAYKLMPETGWLIQAGILHAPGTYVTYEVQKASDVASMYQSTLEDRPVSKDLLLKNVPPEHRDDLNYIVGMIDWEVNVDPEFKRHHYSEPKLIGKLEETRKEGYTHKWIAYGTDEFSAKKLTVLPKSTVKIKDEAAYGLIVIQGHGTIGKFDVECPTMVRYSELTDDELFVTAEAAKDGVEVVNKSNTENLVVLKHFGPGNPATPKTLAGS